MSTAQEAVRTQRLGTRYELLLFAFVVSGLGNWIYRLALPLLVLQLTGSALNTATVAALEYAPMLVLSLPSGVFADRFDRRKILIVGDLVATALAGLLAVIVSAGAQSVWSVYLVAFLLACIEPLYLPAFQSIVPHLVRDNDLERANAWLQMGDNVMSLAGPAVAGTLIAALGYEGVIWADAGTFALSALTILAIKASARPSASRKPRHLVREITEAVVHITKDNPILLSGSVLFAVANLGTWLVQANLIYYLSVYYSMAPSLIGVVFTAQGVGAVLGAAVCPWLARRFAPGKVIIAGTVLAGGGLLALLGSRDIVSISVAWALIYGLGTVNMVSWFVLRQRIVPAHLLGRVVATTRMIVFMSIPVASVLGGVLEQHLHDMYLIIVIAGALRVLAGLVGLASPLNSRIGWRSADPSALEGR